MTDAEIAKIVVNSMKFKEVEPDNEFTSASGINHGFVEAWNFDDDKCAIAYGNNANTRYAIGDTSAAEQDLASWLLTDGIGDNPLERASVMGKDGIDLVEDDYTGPVKILVHHHMHDSCGNGDKFRMFGGHDWDDAPTFDGSAAAIKALKEAYPEDEPYDLEHNEYDSPDFYIVAA